MMDIKFLKDKSISRWLDWQSLILIYVRKNNIENCDQAEDLINRASFSPKLDKIVSKTVIRKEDGDLYSKKKEWNKWSKANEKH